MKKANILGLSGIIIFLFLVSCRAKVEEAPPPPPPQVKEQPKVEKVKEVPPVKKPELTEEEIFQAKSLEEVNREAPLKMIHFDFDRYFIRDDAKPALTKNAAWLKKFNSSKILIEGHCDERGLGYWAQRSGVAKKQKSSIRDYRQITLILCSKDLSG